MPIREWKNWDQCAADDDLWESVDALDRKRDTRQREAVQMRRIEYVRARRLKKRLVPWNEL